MTSSVTILMGSYNGGRFIGEQLDTIEGQSHGQWSLTVSDDGSTDHTVEVLRTYQDKWGQDKLRLRQGPGRGFCRNFLSLACDPGARSDYYAFSDQDDLWEPGKLSAALEWLDAMPCDVPALYCGRTRSVDEGGAELGLSPHFKKRPSFRNALIQSIAGGNTMVFNEAARQLIVAAGSGVDVPSHDWWLYILVTGCGGVVKYDPVPMLNYRQHGGNLVGSNTSLMARASRIVKLLRGRLRDWNTQHLEALSAVTHLLSQGARDTLERFGHMRQAPVLRRISRFRNLGIYRQTGLGQAGLMLAVTLGKI